MKRLSAAFFGLLFSLVLSTAALSLPAQAQQGGADERAHIMAAQQAVSRQFGGRKLNHSWRDGQLLLVWQAADGSRLLVSVDPRTGAYRVLRRENPRR